MAWARAGQVTAEANSIEEFDTDVSVGAALPTISSTTAKTGTYSVRYQANAFVYPTGVTFADADCVRVSFWFRHNDTGGVTSANLVKLMTAGSIHAQVTFSVTGNLALVVNGSTKETKTAAECTLDQLNTWQHLALTFAAHASTGYVTFYVDGVAVLSWAGAVTGAPTGAYVGGTANNGWWTAYAYYDDLYVDTAAYGEIDVCPEGRRFVPKLLDGTTSNVTWAVEGAATAHAALATNDGDTSYLLSVAAGDLFVGTLGSATIPAEHVAVKVHTLDFAKRGDAASTLKTSLIDGSANIDESAEMEPGTSYTRQWATFDTAPDGGAWDNTKVNDISLGIESAGTFA